MDLTQLLMDKEKYLPDSKNCQHCDRAFMTFWRKRYRCRKCGLQYCDECSSHFVDGIHFKREERVRFCGRCYDQVIKILKAEGYKLENSIKEENTRSRRLSSSSSEEQQDDEVVIQNLFEKNKESEYVRSQFQQLKERGQQHIEKICEHALKLFIHQDIELWRQVTFEFMKRGIEDIQFSTLKNDPMDITQFIKIKVLPYRDYSLTSYFKGLVIRKNVALKYMSTELRHPKVLLMQGHLDFIEESQQFEEFINKEKRVLHEYIDKINEYFQPNILFVEKQVNKLALDLCYKYNIVVVQNVKMHHLRKISKCVDGEIVKLDKLDLYIKKDIIGECESICFRNFVKNNTAQITPKDTTLMFLETKDGKNGVTITISGPQEDYLKNLKKCMLGCLRLGKHFDTETHIVACEQKLRQGKLAYPQAGDFSQFLFEKLSIKEVINEVIAYVKINYARADLHNFNDIKDMNALLQYQKDFPPQKEPSISFFADMCSLTQKEKALFNQQDDISLGAFIILKVANLESRCENCKLPRNSHVSIYYNSERYVKFSVDTNHLHSKLDTNRIYTLKDVPYILKMNHSDEKLKIETYLECNTCMSILTDRVTLSQHYLEYSFLRFLQHLFLTPIIQQQQINTGCNHQQVSRVYAYQNHMLKVVVGQSDQYQTSLISFSNINLNEYLRNCEIQYIKQQKDDLMNKLNIFGTQLINLIPKQLQKNEMDLLIKSIIQLKEECEKILIETQFSSVFQIFKQQQEFGVQYKQVQQKIMEHKKKKELHPDFKNLIQNATNTLKSTEIIKTAYDLEKVDSANQLEKHEKLYHSHQELDEQQMNKNELTDLIITTPFNGDLETLDMQDTIVQDDQGLLVPQSPLFPGRNNTRTDSITIHQRAQTMHLESSLITLEQESQPTQSPWNISGFIVEQSKLQKSQMIHEYVPIYENQPLSYLAFTFNHPKYVSEIHQKENFMLYEGTKREDAKIFYQKLLAPKENPTDRFMSADLSAIPISKDSKDVFTLRINYDQKNLTGQMTNYQMNNNSQFDDEKLNPNPNIGQQRKNKYIEVMIYFPTQFEALRLLSGITLSQFIQSITSTNVWSASGGKSQSTFYKSHDELFIFKKLEHDKEFMMFKQFALEYFKRMYRHFYESKQSLLTKIFGMFEIRDKGSTEYFLVMENLYFGLGDPSQFLVYDLKGSETNRLEKKKKSVLLDTNFRIDRNSEPIPLIKECYRYIDKALLADCKFLNKQNVIDYSLLLIIDQKQLKIRMGIIDYLRFYTWDKETEHYLKYLLKGGMVPTIVNPGDYRKRFLKAINKYFISV